MSKFTVSRLSSGSALVPGLLALRDVQRCPGAASRRRNGTNRETLAQSRALHHFDGRCAETGVKLHREGNSKLQRIKAFVRPRSCSCSADGSEFASVRGPDIQEAEWEESD